MSKCFLAANLIESEVFFRVEDVIVFLILALAVGLFALVLFLLIGVVTWPFMRTRSDVPARMRSYIWLVLKYGFGAFLVIALFTGLYFLTTGEFKIFYFFRI